MGEQIAQAKRTGADATELLAENKRRADEIKALDAQLASLEDERSSKLPRGSGRHANQPRVSPPIWRSFGSNWRPV